MMVKKSDENSRAIALKKTVGENYCPTSSGDTKQSRLASTTEITQNKHVKVLHYFVDDIK
jgi:hypothetical protein